jgi:seryl-tRNA synthetase
VTVKGKVARQCASCHSASTMHDIKLIRENPEAFDAALARRGVASASTEILEPDRAIRSIQPKLEAAQAQANSMAKSIGIAVSKGDTETAERLKGLVSDAKVTIPQFQQELRVLNEHFRNLLAGYPNLPDPDVPNGTDEAQNVEVSRWGTPRTFNFTPKEHADLGPALGLDFETGAAISGARFTFLRGQMARLQRALGQFMLDHQTATNGYSECAPPLLVREDALFGTGQLPKFAEDNFQTTDGRWLIPTAEVSLTNSVREQILDAASLPIRLTALTPCFRSEAGAAGKDTRGYIRQHQFEKVELVTVCKPEDSAAEHERMVAAAESILQALELPYRKMLLCAGDMGFTARKTYDLEVWLPGQDAYREISSVSNCGDFQARRMNTRYRPEGGKGTEFVHTLNGSGLAVGRTLVAVLENYQQEDGSVAVPEALLPYMGGLTRLVP